MCDGITKLQVASVMAKEKCKDDTIFTENIKNSEVRNSNKSRQWKRQYLDVSEVGCFACFVICDSHIVHR